MQSHVTCVGEGTRDPTMTRVLGTWGHVVTRVGTRGHDTRVGVGTRAHMQPHACWSGDMRVTHHDTRVGAGTHDDACCERTRGHRDTHVGTRGHVTLRVGEGTRGVTW